MMNKLLLKRVEMLCRRNQQPVKILHLVRMPDGSETEVKDLIAAEAAGAIWIDTIIKIGGDDG